MEVRTSCAHGYNHYFGHNLRSVAQKKMHLLQILLCDFSFYVSISHDNMCTD